MEFINKIICGDCLEVMKQMPDESVDLVVTSPPYNLKNSTGNGMKAGKKYTDAEMSFRQTIHGLAASDRGFKVVIDHAEQKVLISFDSELVAVKHLEWRNAVAERIGLGELNPQPYWGFDDLAAKARTKLHNCFYVQAAVKRENGLEFYHYQKILRNRRKTC